jgi:hypothetical protein
LHYFSEVSGEFQAVTGGGIGHPITQLSVQARKPFAILGKINRQFHILVFIVGDQFR